MFGELLFYLSEFMFSPETGFKTKPRRRNKFPGRFIYLPEFAFSPKTGFETKTRRRNNFVGEQINLFARPYDSEKPVVKLNLFDRINSMGGLFICLILGFCHQAGLNDKPLQRHKFPERRRGN